MATIDIDPIDPCSPEGIQACEATCPLTASRVCDKRTGFSFQRKSTKKNNRKVFTINFQKKNCIFFVAMKTQVFAHIGLPFPGPEYRNKCFVECNCKKAWKCTGVPCPLCKGGMHGNIGISAFEAGEFAEVPENP